MENAVLPTCRFCFSKNVVKWTRRRNISGWKQRWICKSCRRTFTPDDGFLWKHHRPWVIVEVLSLHLRGLSEREAKDHMWQNHSITVSTGTVGRWTLEYGILLGQYASTLKPTIEGNIHSDEVVIKVRGKDEWRWGSIDKATKYKISGPLTKRRSYEDGAKPLYRKIRHGCEGLPPRMVSDRLGHYRKAFNKYFHNTGTKMVHGVPIACRKHGLEHNNNPAERDNGRVKQRIKTMRGFKSHHYAQAFLDLVDVHHNHIRPSMALDGRYPAEEAGIRLPLGRNRLLSLILLTS